MKSFNSWTLGSGSTCPSRIRDKPSPAELRSESRYTRVFLLPRASVTHTIRSSAAEDSLSGRREKGGVGVLHEGSRGPERRRVQPHSKKFLLAMCKGDV